MGVQVWDRDRVWSCGTGNPMSGTSSGRAYSRDPHDRVEIDEARVYALLDDRSALRRDGRYRANVWTGAFPALNTGADGYKVTSPVGAYGRDGLGFEDLAGNVWEWTADWYAPYGAPAATPGREKAQRGGSFLCDPDVCYGFRVSGRAHATPDSALMHVGFRCAREPVG